MSKRKQRNESPIIFTGEMVRAIFDGRKTQTRRLSGLNRISASDEPWIFLGMVGDTATFGWTAPDGEEATLRVRCPYGQSGGLLWVRERHAFVDSMVGGYDLSEPVSVAYADHSALAFNDPLGGCTPIDTAHWNWDHESIRWRAPMFHPRWACRLLLRVTSIRVERLQDIDEEGAKGEGVPPLVRAVGCTDACPGLGSRECCGLPGTVTSYRDAFELGWDGIHAKRKGGATWEADPFVWVVGFEPQTC